ncbi:MAG: polyphosphate polymerase domain-containing protein [Chloroflexi bacterium]|nr:polyphosphate polymerase domain-containing protein [Chloroflexota bacterium]
MDTITEKRVTASARPQRATRCGEAPLEHMEPISLAEMDAVALLDRVDTKHVLQRAQLPQLLAALTPHYLVLEVAGVRQARYRTLYFDTRQLELYGWHHAGRAERFKVRSRAYVDSGLAFLEIKRKTNHGRTLKERMPTAALLIEIGAEADAFVSAATGAALDALQPTLWNTFERITLVSNSLSERLTIDTNLRFEAHGSACRLAGVAVVEVKQARRDRESQAVRELRALGVRPNGFSKYCLGVAMLYPTAKHNRFKPVLREVKNLMRGGHDA